MDNHWSTGYVVETQYPIGYFHELALNRARWALLLTGQAALDRPVAACELGFGRGLSVNIHAAGNPSVAHWGDDFNPAQASFAQGLATASANGAQLADQSFEEFGVRADLPDFDFIGLHGVWSWVSRDNRERIVDFIRRKLKPGGVAYVSYNALPGWAPLMPLRQMLNRHADLRGRPGDSVVQKTAEAIAFVERLLALNPGYTRGYPGVTDFFGAIKGRDPHHLAHEYFTRDWEPMYFADAAQQLTQAKLTFGAPADLLDHVNPLHLTPEAMAFLGEIREPVLRETVRDFLVSTQFRRDYWIKGATALPPPQRSERLRAARVALLTSPARVPLKVRGALGEMALLESAHKPVVAMLAEDGYAPKRIGDLERRMSAQQPAYTLGHLVQALTTLVGAGYVDLVQESDAEIAKAREPCRRLNRALLEHARRGLDISHLASPVTGAGAMVPHMAQLLLSFSLEGVSGARGLAEAVWEVLSGRGQTLRKDGRALPDAAANIAELERLAVEFGKDLPAWAALGLA